MKAVLTVWLPVAALVVFTVMVILQRRGDRAAFGATERVERSEQIPRAVSTATAFKVIDGDSVKVTFGSNIPVSIRLAGIDAPELGQHYGFEAKENLERLLEKNPPELEFEGNGKYGRKVCILLSGNLNLNLSLVENGFAWATPEAEAPYLKAQKSAQGNGLGIWSFDKPMPPWEWRAKK